MPARILNGVAVAEAIRAEARPRIQAFQARAGRPPGLAIVLVGDNPASEIYVRNKVKGGGEAGLAVRLERLPSAAALEDLLGLIRLLNGDPTVDGILVQSPLPGVARRRRLAAGLRRHRPRERRRRVSPNQRRTAGAGTTGLRAVHAGRHHRAAGPVGHRDRRHARRRARPVGESSDGRWRRSSWRATRPSRSVIRRRRTSRPSRPRETWSSRRSAGPRS